LREKESAGEKGRRRGGEEEEKRGKNK